MSTVDWTLRDRALERADGCTGCRRHQAACVCPTRTPVRLRLVTTDPPADNVFAFPLNNDDARLHPGAA